MNVSDLLENNLFNKIRNRQGLQPHLTDPQPADTNTLPRQTAETTSKVANFVKNFPWKTLGYSAALGLTLSATIGLSMISPWWIPAVAAVGGTLSLFLAYKVYETAFSNNEPFPQPPPAAKPPPLPPPLPPRDDKIQPPPLPPSDDETQPPPPFGEEINPAEVILTQIANRKNSHAFQKVHEDEEEYQEELKNSPTEDYEWDLD